MNREKFKSLVHYVCWRCEGDPLRLGAVKLNKILWLADTGSYYECGQPITGVRYVKRQHGPVPALILPILRELEEAGVLSIRESAFHGFTKREFLVHREASGAFLTDAERSFVDRTIEFVCDHHTAASISEVTHDPVWKAASDGEELPYYTIFARPGRLTEDDRAWARQQLESEYARQPMRTVIEEPIVSEVIDREIQTYPRLEEAFEGLKWWLAHVPDSGEPIDDLNWLYRQEGDANIKLPALVVIYTFTAQYVTLKYILVRVPIA